MRNYAVILAAGRGERMGGQRNKALLPIGGRPLLAYSVETMRGCADQVLVVVSGADCAEIRALLPDCRLVLGGATRQESEWCALAALRATLQADDVVAIHDAARPLVSVADVQALFREATLGHAVMLAQQATLPLLAVGFGSQARSPELRIRSPGYGSGGVGSTESGLAIRDSGLLRVTYAYPPSSVWCAQTPQAARASALIDAYEQARRDGFSGTDTAAVLTRYGCPVRILPASAPNPKVTVPDDIALVEQLLAQRRRC